MRPRVVMRCALLLLALVGTLARPAPAPAAARADAASQVMGELLRRIRANGRAEVAVERTVVDPLGGGRRTMRGRLALEPPDRADVRFQPGGERIVVRADGGEWIQPELSQLLVLGPERAAAAHRWSRILLVEKGAGLIVRRLAPGRFLVVAPNPPGVMADSARVWIGASGLPTRLEIREEADEPTVYRFSGWHFSRPRGRSAFVIEPPAGYEVIRLP